MVSRAGAFPRLVSPDIEGTSYPLFGNELSPRDPQPSGPAARGLLKSGGSTEGGASSAMGGLEMHELLLRHKESLSDAMRKGFERNELLLRNIYEVVTSGVMPDRATRRSGVDPFKGLLQSTGIAPNSAHQTATSSMTSTPYDVLASFPQGGINNSQSDASSTMSESAATGAGSYALKTTPRGKPSGRVTMGEMEAAKSEAALTSVNTSDVKDLISGAQEALQVVAHTVTHADNTVDAKGGRRHSLADLQGASTVALPENTESNGHSLRWRRARASTRGSEIGILWTYEYMRQNWRPWLKEQLINGGLFRGFCSLVIAVDSVLIGVETDHVVRYGEETATAQRLQLVHNTIVGWYLLEIVLRMICERPMINFVIGKDWRWNLFDFVLIVLALADFFVSRMSLRQFAIARLLRVLRLIRVMRMLRIFRYLTFLREFHKLVLCLASSLQTLGCVFSLMTFWLFGVAIMFTQSVTRFMEETDKDVPPLVLQELHGFTTVGNSMLSLYMAITAGRNWGDQYNALVEVDSVTAASFVIFLVVSIYGLTNVVTAVFVESAMQATQNYRDLLVQEMLVRDRANVKHMKEIFRSIDTDDSGTITLEEMQSYMCDESLELQEYFEALDLTASDTETLFKLLDCDMSGAVDIDEFCDGCMRLGGPAKSFDMNCMWYEQRRTNREILKFIQHACTGLHNLSKNQADAADLAGIANRAARLSKGERVSIRTNSNTRSAQASNHRTGGTGRSSNSMGTNLSMHSKPSARQIVVQDPPPSPSVTLQAQASTSVDHSILALYERLSSTYAANKDPPYQENQRGLDMVAEASCSSGPHQSQPLDCESPPEMPKSNGSTGLISSSLAGACRQRQHMSM